MLLFGLLSIVLISDKTEVVQDFSNYPANFLQMRLLRFSSVNSSAQSHVTRNTPVTRGRNPDCRTPSLVFCLSGHIDLRDAGQHRS
jgi:hypothetical protein